MIREVDPKLWTDDVGDRLGDDSRPRKLPGHTGRPVREKPPGMSRLAAAVKLPAGTGKK